MTLQAAKPYPDELLSSAIVRCSRHYLIPVAALGAHLFGRRKWKFRFLSVPPLPAMSSLFRVPEDDLLWDHTVFPYATAYTDSRVYQTALDNALTGATESKIGTLLQNATAASRFRRYCADCAREELRALGETYWHRAHNLPGVWVCLRHSRYLHGTNLAMQLASSSPLELPHETSGRSLAMGLPISAHLEVAKRSAVLLQRDRGPPLTWDTAGYRELALKGGWLGQARQINRDRIDSLLTERLGRKYLDACELGSPTQGYAWISLMMRPATTVPFVPLKHVLLRSLFSRRRPLSEIPLDHTPPGPSGTHARLVDTLCAARARGVLMDILRRKEVGLSTEEFLRRAGCFATYHHRLHELPKLRSVVLKFRSSPATTKRLRPGKTLYRTRAYGRLGVNQ